MRERVRERDTESERLRVRDRVRNFDRQGRGSIELVLLMAKAYKDTTHLADQYWDSLCRWRRSIESNHFASIL